MPGYVVKTSPEEDLYVYWSDNVEGPLTWGTREQMRTYLASRSEGERRGADERLEQADRYGSSAMWPSPSKPYYGWEDGGMIYQQQGLLPRARLRDLVQRILDANDGNPYCTIDPDVSDLLEPLED